MLITPLNISIIYFFMRLPCTFQSFGDSKCVVDVLLQAERQLQRFLLGDFMPVFLGLAVNANANNCHDNQKDNKSTTTKIDEHLGTQL